MKKTQQISAFNLTHTWICKDSPCRITQIQYQLKARCRDCGGSLM